MRVGSRVESVGLDPVNCLHWATYPSPADAAAATSWHLGAQRLWLHDEWRVCQQQELPWQLWKQPGVQRAALGRHSSEDRSVQHRVWLRLLDGGWQAVQWLERPFQWFLHRSHDMVF